MAIKGVLYRPYVQTYQWGHSACAEGVGGDWVLDVQNQTNRHNF